ncbi:hypothetical protein [uncultured Jatrophihabitans sp.]|uniref:hypothetical protein n=1 Tax=uncultured Jatrophihabitans sp. TaxID=1610747 RepID=UPI0035CA595F
MPDERDRTHADKRHDDDSSLLDVWHSLSDPRQAAFLAWLAFLVTWAVTRLITIHGKDSGKGAAISIAGHHVHHYLFGLILLGITSAIAIFGKPHRGWEWLGIGYGIALALILDEYALLLNLNDVYWKQQGQLSVDVVLAFLALGAAYLTGMTWIHESLRRARRRAFRRPRRRAA